MFSTPVEESKDSSFRQNENNSNFEVNTENLKTLITENPQITHTKAKIQRGGAVTPISIGNTYWMIL